MGNSHMKSAITDQAGIIPLVRKRGDALYYNA